VVLLSLYNANSGQLLTIAVAFSAALSQGLDQAQLAKLGAFFTIVGDTLALYALEPAQPGTAAAQNGTPASTAVTSAISLGETL
jgi:hypothetical protein